MRLTAPARKGSGATSRPDTRWTVPGTTNRNGQVVVEATGMGSTTMRGQKIYRLRCNLCANEYGCNGTDIFQRKCPATTCQGGEKGEPLPERQPRLDFGS